VELRQLRYFVTVAEELHFGRAAERLLIGQPAVSQQIRRLERELRVELFDRTPRTVRLTSAGQSFLPAARAVLTAEDAARAIAAELATGRTGVLRLGTITGLGERLDRILDVFETQAPGMRLELVALPARERLAQLADGRLDAAFVRGTIPAHAPELAHLPLWQDALVAAVPARHPLAERATLRLADLAELPLRLTERRNNPSLVDLVLSSCHAAGFEPVPGPSPSGALQDALAAIGSGTPMWTVVYAANAKIMRIPRVAFVPFEPGLALPTGLAVRQGPLSPGLDLLLTASGADPATAAAAASSAVTATTSGDQDS
jgi:DNA-binding transcriptional LysR family regulator